jgi:hypothetical protein
MRRRGPVPYELMQPGRGVPTPSRSSLDEGPVIGPGRSVRVPVGYLPVVAVLAMVVGGIGYAWGFSRGRSEAQQDAARTLEGVLATRTIADPLAATAADAANASPRGGAGSANAVDGDAGVPPLPLPPPADGDPRVSGLNYFVLSHASPAMAPELIEFCRREGLEAHLVEDNRGVRRKVIVLPGYADGDRLSPTVQALERRIREVGLRWKAQRRGNEDFSGAYPELFRRP